MNRKRIFVASRIKVVIEIDSMGCWMVTPVNQRLQKALKRHCMDMYECGCHPWDGYHYIQYDWHQDEFAEHARLSNSERADINNGWPVTKLVDPELFLHLVGYDAHLITW